MERGLLHIYYGDGKGKTTAAVGLAVRALGNGLSVCFAQLTKSGRPPELVELERMGAKVICGAQTKFSFQMNDEEKTAALESNDRILDEALATSCDLLVIDEAVGAYRTGFITAGKLEKFIADKPVGLEVVLTGRDPAPFLLEAADYATEMVCEKHPFEQGIKARKGIEY